MDIEKKDSIILPQNVRGRSIHTNVIPTVCNIKNMLEKLTIVNGDIKQLKQWEKRSYKAYQIETIKKDLFLIAPEKRIDLIKEHILRCDPNDLGASCIDIYLVAFVAEMYGVGKQVFFEYILKNAISDKENTAQAIWQVGRGDGVYLGVLNEDGTIKDWNFFAHWIKGK